MMLAHECRKSWKFTCSMRAFTLALRHDDFSQWTVIVSGKYLSNGRNAGMISYSRKFFRKS